MKSNKAEISIDQIIKIIIMVLFILIVIYLISTAFVPEFANQGDRAKDAINLF